MFTQISFKFRSSPSHQYRGPYNARTPVCQTRNSLALSRGDQPLSGNEEPTLGAHLVTPRLVFAHHGIYVGGGNVVHYGALAHQFRAGLVEEISLAFFAHGHAVFVRPHAAPRFEGADVIHRARSRLGEDRYGVLRNNCEHFCEWCVQGVPRCYQVERVLKFPSAVARTIGAALALIRTTPYLGRSPRLRRVLPAQSSSNTPPGICDCRPQLTQCGCAPAARDTP